MADAPVATGNFKFVYPNVYVVIETAGPNGLPTVTVNTLQPTATQESRDEKRITDPRRFFNKTAFEDAFRNNEYLAVWGTTECISPTMYGDKPSDVDYDTTLVRPGWREAGFTGPNGKHSGQFDPLDFWNFLKNNIYEIPQNMSSTLWPVHVPEDKEIVYKDCTKARKTDDWSTDFELSVCSCEGMEKRFTLEQISNVGCSVSNFKWSYDVVGPQAVRKSIKAALNVSEACSFDDGGIDGWWGKIPRELKLVSETILPPMAPPSWMASEETKQDIPAAPMAGEGPKQANGNPQTTNGIPQTTNSTPKQTKGPVVAVIPLGPGATQATVIHDKNSNLNTYIQGSTTSVFAGSEVTVASHRIQISEGRDGEGDAGKVVLRVDGSEVSATFTPIATSIPGGGGSLQQPYGSKGPVVQTSIASTVQFFSSALMAVSFSYFLLMS
jgi:hypothetical protein